MKKSLLGGLAPSRFLRNYWQKKPLLVRNALPGFKGFVTPRQLMQLACNEEAQARLVIQRRGKWHVEQGPFALSDFNKLPLTDWTLLVQEVNHFLPEAQYLLREFSFIPHARLADLMVSFAPRKGGVGPHYDSYNVFLLQGMGRRRWQISSQQDKALVPGAPLKILQRFQPGQEWILNPGDMLYLPPGYSHNGIAVDDCITYSVGFRAPTYQELAAQFLIYLQDSFKIDGMYRDRGLRPQRHPARIGTDMQHVTASVLGRITWSRNDIVRFLGTYLTEPKAHVFFRAPTRPLSRQEFLRRASIRSVRLELKTRMLYAGRTIFVNGEAFDVGAATRRALQRLANRRELLTGAELNDEAANLLYQWYLHGYIVA